VEIKPMSKAAMKMLQCGEFGQFPIQDDICTGESGHGYVLRMATNNLLTGIPAVKNMLGKTRYAVLEAADAPKVASWFGADLGKLELAFGITGTGKREQQMVFQGCDLNRSYFVNRMHPRVCVPCLEEMGRCSAVWEISLVTTCSRHGRWLQDICPNCSQSLSWNRPGLKECLCGNVLTVLDESPSPTLLDIEFAQWVSGALEGPSSPEKSTSGSLLFQSTHTIVHLLAPLTLQGGLSLVQALGTAQRCSQGDFIVCDRRKSSLLAAHETLYRASTFLATVLGFAPIRIKAAKLSVVVKLLAENAASHCQAADRSLALSVLQKLIQYKGRSGWDSPHPHLSQIGYVHLNWLDFCIKK